jgi:hypothetical protein
MLFLRSNSQLIDTAEGKFSTGMFLRARIESKDQGTFRRFNSCKRLPRHSLPIYVLAHMKNENGVEEVVGLIVTEGMAEIQI